MFSATSFEMWVYHRKCTNIIFLTTSGSLTDGVQSVFSPRFNPQGDRLVYFESITGWAHHTCAALKMVIKLDVGYTLCNAAVTYRDFQIEWDSKAVTTVIDIVGKPQSKLELLKTKS